MGKFEIYNFQERGIRYMFQKNCKNSKELQKLKRIAKTQKNCKNSKELQKLKRIAKTNSRNRSNFKAVFKQKSYKNSLKTLGFVFPIHLTMAPVSVNSGV